MLDADALREAMEPPSIKIDGQVYTGRLLSFQEFLPFQKKLEELPEPTPISAVLTLLQDVYDKAGLPTDKLGELPPGVVSEALNDFFDCQLNARPRNGKKPATSES